MQIPENLGAIAFWEKVIGNFTHGKYEQTQKIVEEPTPHPMRILKFRA